MLAADNCIPYLSVCKNILKKHHLEMKDKLVQILNMMSLSIFSKVLS